LSQALNFSFEFLNTFKVWTVVITVACCGTLASILGHCDYLLGLFSILIGVLDLGLALGDANVMVASTHDLKGLSSVKCGDMARSR